MISHLNSLFIEMPVQSTLNGDHVTDRIISITENAQWLHFLQDFASKNEYPAIPATITHTGNVYNITIQDNNAAINFGEPNQSNFGNAPYNNHYMSNCHTYYSHYSENNYGPAYYSHPNNISSSTSHTNDQNAEINNCSTEVYLQSNNVMFDTFQDNFDWTIEDDFDYTILDRLE